MIYLHIFVQNDNLTQNINGEEINLPILKLVLLADKGLKNIEFNKQLYIYMYLMLLKDLNGIIQFAK